MNMNTYKTKSFSADEIKRKWLLVNAEGQTLGRLASVVASRLKGKDKPQYTPNADCGDYVIIINAEKIKVTGNKREDKMYYRHSEYPGGLKEMNFNKLQDKHPERIIELAIKGMLPKGPLGRDMYRKLKVYAGDKHDHQAQQPELLAEI